MGLSRTVVTDVQLRVAPLQRSGCCRRARSYTACRCARISVARPVCRSSGVTNRIALC